MSADLKADSSNAGDCPILKCGGIYYTGDCMIKRIKKYAALIISAVMLCGSDAFAEDVPEREYIQSYVLMESSTGTVIRDRDGDKRVRMGSFNKLMTVLLATEALDRGELTLDTELTASEHANSMQGAQIWLMPGEKMTLRDLLKGVIIGNANDAACVIAEKIGGTEEKFTQMMNSRAVELGMNDTLFMNSTGFYDDDKQYTTAADAALLLAELSKHDILREMFTSRLDELKNGEVQLVSENRLAYNYKGAVGFKCGFGPSSGYFAAEAAERDGICYVAAVFDCENENTAMALAREILDIGFDGYTLTSPVIPDDMPSYAAVKQGCVQEVRLAVEPVGDVVVPKGCEDDIEAVIYLPSYVYAPLERGDRVGELRLFLNGSMIRSCSINAAEDVCSKNFSNVLSELMKFLVTF